MKNKAVHKSVSAIICIAMLFALIPALSTGARADESLSGTMIVYDFRYKAYPGESASLMADPVFSDYTQIRPWAYIGDKNLGSAASNNTVYCQFVCWSIPSGQNAWAAFKIDVPAAGRYNANLGYYRYNNGGIFGVYIVPYTPEAAANIDEYLVPENKKAQVDSYYSGTAGTTEIALPDISFEEDGDYILIFRAEGKQQASGGCNTLISTLTLAGMEYSGYNHEITFGGIGYHLISELSGEAGYTLTGGQYCYAGCTAGWTPGSKNITQGNYLQYEINTDGNWVALEVDIPHAGKYEAELTHLRAYSGTAGDLYLMPATGVGNIENGFIYQNLIGHIHFRNQGGSETATTQLSDMYVPSAGKYYLVLKRNYVVNEYTYMLKLNMNGLKFGQAHLAYDKYEIEPDETATATVTALMNDGITPATGYTIDGYTSSNEAVATVDSSGVVTGVAAGTAEITVFVTLDGVTVTATSTITVTAPVVLSSIAVTTPPNKTVYKTGEALDITGLVVTGTYSDSSTEVLSVTAENITGFDSSTDAPSQTLTVTVDGKTATFDVKVVRVLDSSYATGSITVDGNANEPAWSINHNIPANTGDNTATFGTLWDEDYLYVYVDVVDDVLVNNSNKHYYDDCVEIYIDGDMVKGEYNSHCAQYTFRYGDATKYVHPVSTASTDGVEHISRATESGYAVELKIPWSSIGGLTVEEGKTIGFTVHVNDKDTTDNPAGKEEDIIFYTVDSPNEDYQDSTNWAEMTLIAWENPVENSGSTGSVNIGAEGAASGAITATVNGVPVDISNPGDLTLGDVVEMNADPEPEAGKEFLFWMDPVSKRLISNQQQVTFTVGTDTQITAVYKDAGAGHIVIFFDRNGKVLSNEYLADGAAITAPETPYSVGYSFTGWSPTVPSVAKNDYAFIAQYEEEDGAYTVTVENGSISPEEESYKYNTKVTVTAASPEEGRKFAYWTKNGVIVSYASTYSFYVWDDTEICAVSVPEAETVSPAPAIYMDDNVKNDGESGRLIFASERTLPAGYTLIETGILISELNSNPDLDNCDEKAVAQSESGSGQFTARVDGLASDDSRYARAYMIYKTPEGEYKVIYSNAVIGTV